MAASSNSRSVEYDRSGKVNSVEIPSAQEIAEQVSRLMQTKQRSVHFVENDVDAVYYQEDPEMQEGSQEVNYVNSQGFGQNRGFNPNYRNHPNLSYRSTNVANPQDQVYLQQGAAQSQYFQGPSFTQNPVAAASSQGFAGQSSSSGPFFVKPFSQGNQSKQFNQFEGGFQQKQPVSNFQAAVPHQQSNPNDELKAMMQQVLVNNQNKQKNSNDMNVKIDSMYTDLNGKFDAVHTHLKMLDTQVGQTAEAVKRQQGVLPAKGENPRKDKEIANVYAITTRSGKVVEPVTTRKSKVVVDLGDENGFEQRENSESTSKLAADPTERSADQLRNRPIETEDRPMHISSADPEGPDCSSKAGPSDPEGRSVDRPADRPIPAPESTRVYKPRVPYPVPPKKSQKDLEEAKCKEMLSELTVKLPLVDGIHMILALKRYMKTLVTSKMTEQEDYVKVT
ncbi:hypothetical protein V5N11_007537 [Cardamine amara subsp. amara]|uniref:Uncharacterized protein n=1 Tax=Cardamine amara subsp. amara TaxID=228776 RepID=A0ABD1A1P2_CARAN